MSAIRYKTCTYLPKIWRNEFVVFSCTFRDILTKNENYLCESNAFACSVYTLGKQTTPLKIIKVSNNTFA